MTTLPKTYDDMVLRWPITAWLYWWSPFISGILLLFIGEPNEYSPVAGWGRFIQAVGFILIFYVSFAMINRMMMLGDALGFIGAFEKKGE